MNRFLYDSLAKNWIRPNGTVWLYADPHFGDTELNGLRHISDEEQIKQINSIVTKNDTIIILGDVGDLNTARKIKAGYKVLIMGNHDKNVKECYQVFDDIYEGPLLVNNRVLLSHEPVYPLANYFFNIHGHNHFDITYDTRRYLNLCAELIDYKPISLKQIIFDRKALKHTGNIHRDAIDRGIINSWKQ